MSLFKRRKEEKTIKLSDLLYALNKYKDIYNECLTEVGTIINENKSEIKKYDYDLHWYWCRNGKAEFKAFNGSPHYSDIYDSEIRNLIKIYASNDIKEKIKAIENLNDPFNKMTIKYNDVKSYIHTEGMLRPFKQNLTYNFLIYKIDKFEDTYNILTAKVTTNPEITINNASKYNQFINYLNKQEQIDSLFDKDGNLYDRFKGKELGDFDLSNIDFDYKNISGLDISKNLNIHINLDKIKKDVSNCNFNGYDLSKETFRNFNITDTDFRNTGATIDIASCIINEEGKMNSGTLFDENNKFVFASKKLTNEDIERLGIKIKKLERN